MTDTSITLSHIGICVSDLERSLRFYCQGLGFKEVQAYLVGNEYRKLLELDAEIALETRFLARDGFYIELLHFRSPPHTGTGQRRPINLLGFTHMNLRVGDVDAVIATIRAYGGAVHDHTRTRIENAQGQVETDVIYCNDPDGVRIEVYTSPHPAVREP
ncbi:MAG: putative glyoxalase [Rhodospirillales bacterium]|nr:putative glyoxalase [Rhodospirillales bacterium]